MASASICMAYIAVVEELAAGWMSLSGIINTHTIAASLIMRHGSPEQQARWLPGLAAGSPRGCLSLSEADAGSDTRNISCRANRDGDEYVISGTKTWVTNGERAGIVALAARTDEGITCFIVEKDPGPTFRWDHGLEEHRQARLQGHRDGRDVLRRPPRRRRLRARRRGGPRSRARASSSSRSRWDGSTSRHARSVWRGRRSNTPIRYAQERQTFGKPIAEHQSIQQQARRHGHQAAGGASAHRARRTVEAVGCARRRRGRDGEAVRERDRVRDRAPRRCASTVASATPPSCPIERYFRDAPLMIIGEGTNEIQRLVIARGLLQRYAI